ncbi:MAG: exonuclease domain-containing protein [Thermomicrobiales bacterium]
MAEAAQEGYPSLQGKIKAFLLAHGGAVPEDALIRHLFGAGTKVDLWRSFLQRQVGTDGTIAFSADGRWTLAGFRAGTTGVDSLDALGYVVLDVETTGLKAYSQRIIELTALRFRGGREEGIFSTLLRPDRRLSGQIVRLTGITDDLLVDAPAFETVVDELIAFLGDDLIVGHNIGFDLGFLDAELRRAGRPTLLNARLDTLALAQRTLTGQRRWNLDAVAKGLGLRSPGGRHRSEPDARLTAAVFAALLPLAAQKGLRSPDALLGVAGAQGAAPAASDEHGAISRARVIMEPSWLEQIPHVPGCYLMRDARDEILYVGKAKDLNRRVRSYYSENLNEPRKPGLLEAVARIETVVVGSELEALLLEMQLIRRHQPRYNVQGRYHEHYPYIKVDLADAWPRVYATRTRQDDGGRYFGPYRNVRAVRRTLATLEEILPLRNCRQKARSPVKRWSSCSRLMVGKCLGPCIGQTTQEEYGALVADLIRYLEGDVQAIIDRVQALRVAARRRGRAAAEDGTLRRVLASVAKEGALLTTAEGLADAMIVLPAVEAGAVETFLVTRGRLWSRRRVRGDESDEDVADDLRESWVRAHAEDLPPLNNETIDEAAIVTRWLLRHAGSPAILALPGEDTPDGWLALAAAVQAARPAEEVWEVDEVIEQEDEPEDDLGFVGVDLFAEADEAEGDEALG